MLLSTLPRGLEVLRGDVWLELEIVGLRLAELRDGSLPHRHLVGRS